MRVLTAHCAAAQCPRRLACAIGKAAKRISLGMGEECAELPTEEKEKGGEERGDGEVERGSALIGHKAPSAVAVDILTRSRQTRAWRGACDANEW